MIISSNSKSLKRGSVLSLKTQNQPTPLSEAFSEDMEGEWDFRGEYTQYLTHGLHPYLGSLIPQVPRKLIDMYADSKTRILDPFVGGGSILVEAYLKNMQCTGIDINPLAVIISRAKSTPLSEKLLSKVSLLFDEAYQEVEPVIPAPPKSYQIDYWFKPYMFEELARIRAAIGLLDQHISRTVKESVATLLYCIFSRTVRDVSLTYRGEIKLRKLQGNYEERFNPNVILEFKKRMKGAFFQVAQLPEYHRIPHIYKGDARRIAAEEKQFDLVITSPPYGDLTSTIPYDQFSRHMLYWLGFDESVLTEIRRGSLGARDKQKDAPESETLKQALKEIQKPHSIERAICFYKDYYDALKEIVRVTSGRIIIVIGHRVLNDVLINSPQITIEMMRQFDWYLEKKYTRKLTSRRLNKYVACNNSKGGTIDTESILVFVPNHPFYSVPPM